MSEMFAGASRALLISILFAIETTGQSNALLPLLAACIVSYFVSLFLMENYKGIVSSSNLFSMYHDAGSSVETLIKRKPVTITNNHSLKAAVEMMAKENLDVLPIVSAADNKFTCMLSYAYILSAYRKHLLEQEATVAIPLKGKIGKLVMYRKKMAEFKSKAK
jgi:predicted transcriptional regulator